MRDYGYHSGGRDRLIFFLFFFNDTATTEIYTLSLHDALPIFIFGSAISPGNGSVCRRRRRDRVRSEEHTSELQSPCNLVCRLLLEKKKMHCDLFTVSFLFELCRRRHTLVARRGAAVARPTRGS